MKMSGTASTNLQGSRDRGRESRPRCARPGRTAGAGLRALLLAAAIALGGQTPPGDGADGEVLPPGQAQERTITAGAVHSWRLEAAETPLLLTVEQRGIDLVVEARASPDDAALAVDAPAGRWGTEILLLPATAGGYRIEVRPWGTEVPPGRYAIAAEPLDAAAPGGARRMAAAQAMSQAGELVAVQTPEALAQVAAGYREALAGWRGLGERRWEAEAIHAIAALDQARADLPAAAGGYEEAAALWRELGEASREAAVLNGLGRTRLDRGEIDAARQAFEQAAALWQCLGERFDEGEARGNLCLMEQTSGALQAALACYEDARALFRDAGDPGQEARILNNLGGLSDLLGEPDAALRSYQGALALRRKLGDRPGEAQTLNNLGTVHRALGEWQEALRLYGQARQALAPLDDRLLEAALLNNIGYAYSSLGEPQRALVSHQEALGLRRATGDRRGEVITLNSLGLAWRSLGELEQALDHHRQALALAAALGLAPQEAISRLRLAEVEIERREASAALRELEPALAHLAATGNRRGEALAFHLHGQALALAGRFTEALPVLEEVLARRQAVGDRAGQVETLHALATVMRRLGRWPEAKARAEAAVARVEEMRKGFVSPDLRAAFLATQRRSYSLLIDLLMERHTADPARGYDRAAFEISEQARARTLLDSLGQGSAVADAEALPADLLDRRRSLRRRLGAKLNQQLRQSGGRADALQLEIEALLTELDGVEAEIRFRDPHYAGFSDPRLLGVPEVAALLDPGTLLLEYSLGEERSFLWALGAGSFRSFVLPAQQEIDALARRVYEELSTVEAGADSRASLAAGELGRILLGPVWGEAAPGARLVVVPDGTLHLLPFAALPVPAPGQGWDAAGRRQPLVEQQEVVYLPSAATLALARQRLEHRPAAPQRAAVLADPLFAATDPRLAGSALAGRDPPATTALAAKSPQRGAGPGDELPAFERLPGSRREAERIAALAPAGEVWTALDAAASREAVLSGRLRAYRVIHFATHAIADARNPERSGLVLSLVDAGGRPQEGFLGLPEIYELELGADLAVLSGCQTALGRELAGEGLMGLTRGFLYAGVPRVVASLWRVQDRATAELMSRFYRALWRDGASPAAALREAQRSLRRDPRYRDPYSWAGFVLQGEWR